MSLYALDIETACARGCATKCEHALSPHHNRITIIGLWSPDDAVTFTDLGEFDDFLAFHPDATFIGHNLKWDLRQLATHGVHVPVARWVGDTQLLAATCTHKIPDAWLAKYEEERKARNKLLPRGSTHREAKGHSLKTLAPYFLGVEPFWEDPTNHASESYVLKDAEYTYRLHFKLADMAWNEGSFSFYMDKLLPWTKLLLRMELRGVRLDFEAMEGAEREAARIAASTKEQLDALWAPAFAAYRFKQQMELDEAYQVKALAAVEKLKEKTPEKIDRIDARYRHLAAKAMERLEPFNLDSPAQLKWLLKEHLGLNIVGFDEEESTGKPVLKRLAEEREDIRTFLEYRKQKKLVSAFFPSYREKAVDGVIHCTFNATGARTGRLSSSSPNLQQVPGSLKKLFTARPGYTLLTYDESAIEPRILAYLSQDHNLCRILISGEDFHAHTTLAFFPELEGVKAADIKKAHPLHREVGKEVGLAIMYGAGQDILKQSGMKRGFKWSDEEVKGRLSRFQAYYSDVFAFRELLKKALLRGPYTNIMGRMFSIKPADIHMTGLNTLVQGSASDLVLDAANKAQKEWDARGTDAHVLLLEHDAIVAEVPAGCADDCVSILTRVMTDYKLPTPYGLIPLAVEGKVSTVWEK